VIQGFKDRGTQDIYDGISSKEARRKLPKNLWPLAQRKLFALDSATQVSDLRAPPGNRLDELRGAHARLWSIRINERYRLVFRWEEGVGPSDAWLGDYHDSL